MDLRMAMGAVAVGLALAAGGCSTESSSSDGTTGPVLGAACELPDAAPEDGGPVLFPECAALVDAAVKAGMGVDPDTDPDAIRISCFDDFKGGQHCSFRCEYFDGTVATAYPGAKAFCASLGGVCVGKHSDSLAYCIPKPAGS